MILLKKHWLRDIHGPESIDPTPHLGKRFKVLDDNKKEVWIIAEEVLGSLAHPARFQINSKGQSYLISMLDFFGQADGHFFSKDEIREFEKSFEGARVVEPRTWVPSWARSRIWRP